MIVKNLISIRNISNWGTINVTNMKSMFHLCKNLHSLGNLSKLRVDNVTNFSYMFYGCISLKNLEDIQTGIHIRQLILAIYCMIIFH